jgi:hypothetical protein
MRIELASNRTIKEHDRERNADQIKPKSIKYVHCDFCSDCTGGTSAPKVNGEVVAFGFKTTWRISHAGENRPLHSQPAQ